MSASLVGSEMCIRDRQLQSAQPGTDKGQLGCPRTQWRRLRPPLPGKAPPCLLYTSDAADDM
eukprot:14109675-Alexandrium_andersonii.AAC.1